MFNRKKTPDTLKQKRTRYYIRMILGAYLLYTAYMLFHDLQNGVETDQPAIIIAAIVLFTVSGAIFLILSFRGAMRISAMELKEEEEKAKTEEEALTNNNAEAEGEAPTENETPANDTDPDDFHPAENETSAGKETQAKN